MQCRLGYNVNQTTSSREPDNFNPGLSLKDILQPHVFDDYPTEPVVDPALNHGELNGLCTDPVLPIDPTNVNATAAFPLQPIADTIPSENFGFNLGQILDLELTQLQYPVDFTDNGNMYNLNTYYNTDISGYLGGFPEGSLSSWDGLTFNSEGVKSGMSFPVPRLSWLLISLLLASTCPSDPSGSGQLGACSPPDVDNQHGGMYTLVELVIDYANRHLVFTSYGLVPEASTVPEVSTAQLFTAAQQFATPQQDFVPQPKSQLIMPQLAMPQLSMPQLPTPQLPTPQLPVPQLPVSQLPVPQQPESRMSISQQPMPYPILPQQQKFTGSQYHAINEGYVPDQPTVIGGLQPSYESQEFQLPQEYLASPQAQSSYSAATRQIARQESSGPVRSSPRRGRPTGTTKGASGLAFNHYPAPQGPVASQSHVVQQPVAQQPVTQRPIARPPVAQQPIARPTVAQQPVVTRPQESGSQMSTTQVPPTDSQMPTSRQKATTVTRSSALKQLKDTGCYLEFQLAAPADEQPNRGKCLDF